MKWHKIFAWSATWLTALVTFSGLCYVVQNNQGLNESTTLLSTIKSRQVTSCRAFNQEKPRHAGGFQILHNEIIGLDISAAQTTMLTVDENVTSISDSALVNVSSKLKRIIFENPNLTISPTAFRPLLEKIECDFLEQSIKQALINAGANNLCEARYGGEGNTCIVIGDNDNQKLIGLSLKNSQLESITLPSNVTSIDADAFKYCPRGVRTINLNDQNNKPINFIQKNAFANANWDTTYIVHSDETAINLINSEAKYKKIQTKDPNVIYDVLSLDEEFIFKIEKQGETMRQNTLVALTNTGKGQNNILTMPNMAYTLVSTTFEGCQAKEINFLLSDDYAADIKVIGNPFENLKNVKYATSSKLIRKMLLDHGVPNRQIEYVGFSVGLVLARILIILLLGAVVFVIIFGSILLVRRRRK